MLNNFKDCPICSKELNHRTAKLHYWQPLQRCNWHYRAMIGFWEELTYPSHRITFFVNQTEISVYDDEVESCILQNSLSFQDLNTYSKCLEIVRNNNLF